MSFSEVLVSTGFYLVVVGVVYLAGLFLALPFEFARQRFRVRPTLLALRRISAFLVLLWLVGAVGELVWSWCVWGNLYYSTDYVFGYAPFLPITQKTIDMEFGGQRGELNGHSLLYVQMVWCFVTTAVVGSSVLLYRKLRTRAVFTSW